MEISTRSNEPVGRSLGHTSASQALTAAPARRSAPAVLAARIGCSLASNAETTSTVGWVIAGPPRPLAAATTTRVRRIGGGVAAVSDSRDVTLACVLVDELGLKESPVPSPTVESGYDRTGLPVAGCEPGTPPLAARPLLDLRQAGELAGLFKILANDTRLRL